MKRAIVAIMREAWGDLPESSLGEIEDYARRILHMALNGESKAAIEEYVAARQHAFGIASPTAYKEIVARAVALGCVDEFDQA